MSINIACSFFGIRLFATVEAKVFLCASVDICASKLFVGEDVFCGVRIC